MRIGLICTFLLISLSCSTGDGAQSMQGQRFLAQSDLDAIFAKASKLKSLRSFIVSRNGKILKEAYFASYDGDSLDDVRSVTKSVVGILIGIALDKQIIKSVNQPINDYLGAFLTGDPKKTANITIQHLLTMTGGFKWSEDIAEFSGWRRSNDPVAYVLRRPLSSKPGKTFNYNSGASHLLSAIISEASGKTTLEFAQQHLFEPLGIEHVDWQKLPRYYNGGAGLRLHPRDMLKIGQIVVDDGWYNGKRIVSASWLNKTVSFQKKVRSSTGYGYLWWTESKVPDRNAAAIGFGGQFIIVLPDMELVMVATSDWQGLTQLQADRQASAFTSLVRQELYPYLKSVANAN